MAQICVDRNYSGKGLVNMLYQKHKEVYSFHYDFILTEISTSNYRSIKAHEKIGFQSITLIVMKWMNGMLWYGTGIS